MIRVAIIGSGNIGKRHAECYQNNPNSHVIAFCDCIIDRAKDAARTYNCPSFSSVADLLGSGLEFDAASICTSGQENGSHHYSPTIELLNAGKAILGEKPISNNIDEAIQMVALAQKKKIRYGINLNHRFTPAAQLARQWIDDGRIGEMNSIQMRMWINNKNETSEHFHMRALHPHSLDVMRYFAGKVKKVNAFFKKGKGRKIWSNVHLNLQFENNTIGHLYGSYDGGGPSSPWGLETCEIIGSEARIIIEEACEKLIFSPRFSFEQETYEHLGGMGSFEETFQSRLDAWVADLSNKTLPEQVNAKAEDALDVQRVIEAAIQSWSNGSVVHL
ncbi:MAG: Putative oxidoreductase YceM [Candidatus Moanabacter tarae]|uniref:Oxidoreductase YceM n=1 Tax=Candidatus Moanibacter tarae TaxID=2200854 RepID=A0A2Z4AC54_9BACT|nr:MAG: Putative oxidoreductase YceM [Candidatus Moanabacter tarae]|tara:strand:- start:11843 stop:12838 length:996 start_codon:yes stop_codon:yes gene_type:complete